MKRKISKNTLGNFELKAVELLAQSGLKKQKADLRANCLKIKMVNKYAGGACVSRMNITLKAQTRRKLLKYCFDNIIEADVLTVRAIQYIENSIFGDAWVEDKKHGREISNGADIAKEFGSYLKGNKTNGRNTLKMLKVDFNNIDFDFRQLRKIYKDTCSLIEQL